MNVTIQPHEIPVDQQVAILRENIDAIDRQIVDLLRARRAVSRRVQDLRMSQGEPRLAISREREVSDVYVEGLGVNWGQDFALTILRFSKGN